MAGAGGVEPPISGSKPDALPLSYTPVCGCRVIITSWIAPLSTITLRLSLTPTRQFSTAIVILSEVNRYAQISRERPGNLCGWRESNPRSLPGLPARPFQLGNIRITLPRLAARGCRPVAYAARQEIWWSAAVLPSFCGSGKVPVASCGLPDAGCLRSITAPSCQPTLHSQF